jgi:hypothetical protein
MGMGEGDMGMGGWEDGGGDLRKENMGMGNTGREWGTWRIVVMFLPTLS